MLASFRKLSNNFFTKIILLLIVASFMLWGVSDMVGQPKRADVAKVGSLTITADEYYMQLQKLRANMGELFSPELVKKLNLFGLSLQELTAKKLYALEADFLHFNISDAMIKDIIKKDEAFQNENGAFDRAIFERRLQQMRMSERKLAAEIKAMTAEELLQKTVSMQANLPEKYYELLFEATFESRKMVEFRIDDAQIAKVAEPDENEIKGYYEANMAKYTAPEYRNFEYILLDKMAINENIEISEEQLRQAYLQRQKQLMTPEKRNIWQLLYDDKAKAEQAYGLLRSGKKIEVVMRKIAPINKDNLELGTLAKHQFSFDAPDVFTMKDGGFTSPVKTDFGWHIFQVREIKAAFVPAFEDLKEQLSADLRQNQKNKVLQKLLEKLEDGLAAGLSLEKIAGNMKLKLQQSGKIDANGKRGDNTQEFALESFEPLLKAVFTLQVGAISELINLKDGNHIVVGLKEINRPRPRLLQEVHGLVTADLQQEKHNQARNAFGEKIMAELRAAMPIDALQVQAILRQNNVTKSDVLTVARDGTTEGATANLPEELQKNLFAAQKNPQILEYVKQGDALIGGVYLATIKPDKQIDAAKYEELKLRVQKQYDQEVMVQYLNGMQRKYPITLDEKMIESVNKQF